MSKRKDIIAKMFRVSCSPSNIDRTIVLVSTNSMRVADIVVFDNGNIECFIRNITITAINSDTFIRTDARTGCQQLCKKRNGKLHEMNLNKVIDRAFPNNPKTNKKASRHKSNCEALNRNLKKGIPPLWDINWEDGFTD